MKYDTLRNVKFMEKKKKKKMKVRGIALYTSALLRSKIGEKERKRSIEQSLISGNKCSFCMEQSLDAFNRL